MLYILFNSISNLYKKKSNMKLTSKLLINALGLEAAPNTFSKRD